MENKETINNIIYNGRKNKIEILEYKNSFIFYQIDKIENKLPSLNNNKFKTQVKNLLFQNQKFEFNKDIIDKISNKSFNQASFEKLGGAEIKKIRLNSIKDDKKFEIGSVDVLYSLPINTFSMVVDGKEDIFIAKVINYEEKTISQNSDKFNEISNKASAENRNEILKSYDYLLNNKYKVVVNEKTLDRVKNYFR